MVCAEGYKNEQIANALAGSRTRVECLEGIHANRYTTNALLFLPIECLSVGLTADT